MAMSVSSLCFQEAYDARASGRIDLDAYLTHIVAHYRGLRHESDEEAKRRWLPSGFDDEVRDILLSEDYQPFDDADATALHKIFLSAFQGEVPALRTLLSSSTAATEYYLRPLVQISTREGDAQLLHLCYEKGYVPTDYLEVENLLSRRYDRNPSTEWLDVLFEFDYRQWRSDPQQLSQSQTWRHVLWMGADCIRWWIEHGGHKPRGRGLFTYADREQWLRAASIRVLLDHFRIDWFANSGTLQRAVASRDMETVKMLVEAGADVNEDVN